jgi:hypothetical protein
MAIMLDPAVEDTHGVNRRTGELIRPPQSTPAPVATLEEPVEDELLVDTSECTTRGEAVVIAADRPDGTVVVDVKADSAGVLFLSEPFYSERRAFIDGQRATPRRANITFTAIQVPEGTHRVELRLVPRSFHIGVGITVLTLTVWLGAVVARPVPRPRRSALREGGSSGEEGSEGG